MQEEFSRRVATYCFSDAVYEVMGFGHHWFRQWPAALQHQAITWTNDLMSMSCLGTQAWNFIENITGGGNVLSNATENCVLKMANILSRIQ